MQHLISDQVSDLTKIYSKDIELVSISRSKSEELSSAAKQILRTNMNAEVKWQQRTKDQDLPTKRLSESLKNDKAVIMLAKEISSTNEILYGLLGCNEIEVRLTTLSSPMCPKFHADAVVCRMLTTISGIGTEWIREEDVDREILNDLEHDGDPLKTAKAVQHLEPLALSLLKGGRWQRGFGGVVHRSPHDTGMRLLLSYDPIFSN